MNCPICEEGKLKREVITETFEYKGHQKIIDDYVVYKCDVCKEAIVDKATLKSSGKILKKWKKHLEKI